MKAMLSAATVLIVATSSAWGQSGLPFPQADGSTAPPPRSSLESIAKDPFFQRQPQGKMVQGGTGSPELTPAGDLKSPTVTLPNEPVEPYLLTKDVGPFMVLARTFRGPDSERMALALVKELRKDHGLPAYILRTKDYPGRSMIRGIPPTTGSDVMQASTRMPEKIRTLDEAAVMVGNEKTLLGSEVLLKKVRKINPKCLEGMSSPYWWRKGLSYAIRTTNPYVAAQNLYPKTRDRLIVQINRGQHSLVNCPGRFSLQVADFSGRTTYQFNGQATDPSLSNLKTSPLRTAATDAERMAERLAKSTVFQNLGQPVFVYHDRTSSRVYVGSFDRPDDPNAGRLREELLRIAVPLLKSDKNTHGLDSMIVPAISLTDLDAMKKSIKE